MEVMLGQVSRARSLAADFGIPLHLTVNSVSKHGLPYTVTNNPSSNPIKLPAVINKPPRSQLSTVYQVVDNFMEHNKLHDTYYFTNPNKNVS